MPPPPLGQILQRRVSASRLTLVPYLLAVVAVCGALGTYLCVSGWMLAERTVSRDIPLGEVTRRLVAIQSEMHAEANRIAARRPEGDPRILETTAKRFDTDLDLLARIVEAAPDLGGEFDAVRAETARWRAIQAEAVGAALAGDEEKARVLLFSDDYVESRSRSADALSGLAENSDRAIRETLDAMLVKALQGIAVLVSLLSGPIVLWLLATRNLRQYHRDRDRVEKALRESERRFRDLVENVPAGVYRLKPGPDGGFVAANPAMVKMLGYETYEELASANVMDHYADHDLRREFSRRLREEGRVVGAELPLRRRDGRTIWGRISATVTRDESGRILHVDGIDEDITERKLAEGALVESEKRYRLLAQNARDVIVTTDLAFRISYVSPSIEALSGFTWEETLGKSVEELLHPESIPTVREALAAELKVEREGPPPSGSRTRTMELRVLRKDGSDVWVELRASFLRGEDGRPLGVQGSMRDVAQRRESEEALRRSEERYRRIVETANEGILIFDARDRVALANAKAAEMFGAASGEIEGRDFAALAGGDAAWASIRAAARSGRASQTDVRVRRGDSTFWAMASCGPVARDGEEYAGFLAMLMDITDRKNAEHALARSEHLYRGIIETADEGIWIVDADNVVTFVNDRLARLLGRDACELLGRRHYDFIHEESRAVAEANERIRRTGMGTHTDLRLVRRDGSDFWASVSSTPMMDENGEYTGSLGMAADITERKRVEDGNRILAAVSSLFLTGRKVGMAINAVLEMCGRFDGADRAHVFRLSADGSTIHCAFEWCAEGVRREEPRLASVPAAIYSGLLDTLKAGREATVEDVESLTRAVLRDHFRAMDVRSAVALPIFINGRFAGFTSFESLDRRRSWTSADVSVLRQTTDLVARAIERQSAEEALRGSEALYTSLVEHLTQSVFRKDRDGRYVFANWSFCELAKKPLEEIVGKTDRDVFPRELAERFARDDERVLDRGESIEKDEEFEGPDGETIFLHWVRTPVRDARGDIVGLQGIAWDVTERRRAEETVRAASRMEATATLAGGIAHDFNNLMAGILGNAELVQMDVAANPSLMRKLEIISTSARRGGELAQKLLAFARGGESVRQPTDLAPIVREALELQERAIPPGVKVSSDVAPDLAPVRADPAQMTQIVMNLCINAAEAMNGPGTIAISAANFDASEEFARARRGLKPGPHVVLTVADTGSGMTPEVRARVFEPFFTTKFQGRGLGLAAIYGIVRNHDGHIEVESEVGVGSTFRVYLPAMPGARSAAAPKATEERRGGSETVLVVDDEPMILDVTRSILERLGYEVLSAGGGEEGLRIARSHDGPIHLAILDLRMDGLGGADVFPLLRDARPAMKIVVCSGYERDAQAEELLAAGAAGYIVKPFRMDALAREVRAALDR